MNKYINTEADATTSNKDFIMKFTIVKKENKETKYWLTFIRDTQTLGAAVTDPYIAEVQEILLIVSKIIINSKH